MEFHFKADAKFEAKNIDDAFLKLSDHFNSRYQECASDEDESIPSEQLEFIGEMHIRPTKDEEIVVGSKQDNIICECGEKMEPEVYSHTINYHCPKSHFWNFWKHTWRRTFLRC